MDQRFLVDGYNLMHHLGVFDPRQGKTALAQGRARLLDFLKHSFRDQSHRLTVVFDARKRPQGAKADLWIQGIHVLFSKGPELADDLLETLLAAHADGDQIVLVSNDHRLLDSARRRRAEGWTCDRFLGFVEDRARGNENQRTAQDEKQTKLSQREIDDWLAQFSDVSESPDFKELASRYDFGEMPDDID